METVTGLVAQFENFTTAVYALRWLIAIPFLVLAVLAGWGWWNKVTM